MGLYGDIGLSWVWGWRRQIDGGSRVSGVRSRGGGCSRVGKVRIVYKHTVDRK